LRQFPLTFRADVRASVNAPLLLRDRLNPEERYFAGLIAVTLELIG
jgi:hypothetical protein